MGGGFPRPANGRSVSPSSCRRRLRATDFPPPSCWSIDSLPDTDMKLLAAYLLLVLGGNTTPSAEDVTKVVTAVGGEVDEEQLTAFLAVGFLLSKLGNIGLSL